MIEVKISDIGNGPDDGFWIILGGLVLMAVGFGAYFWWSDHRGITSVDIPDDLASQVRDITGEKSRTKAVISALKEFIRAGRG